jgi:uncharacterized Zn-binding protein involved in type VI secretion
MKVMMKVARVNVDNVNGGVIIGPGASTVFVNGSKVSTLGDKVDDHPNHEQPLNIVEASPNVFAEGIRVVRQGDAVNCGHTVSTGSNNVFAN